MKNSLIITILFLVVSPVLGELTKEDLQAIETTVEKSEGRTKEYIDSKNDQVTTKIDEMDERLTAKIEGVDKRLDDLRSIFTAILIALIGLIAVVIGGQSGIWNKLQKSSNGQYSPNADKLDADNPTA